MSKGNQDHRENFRVLGVMNVPTMAGLEGAKRFLYDRIAKRELIETPKRTMNPLGMYIRTKRVRIPVRKCMPPDSQTWHGLSRG